MRRLKRYQFANHRCLIVKYQRDNRYDEEQIATHDRQTMKAVACLSLATLVKAGHVEAVSVIGIDEGQFFPDTLSFAEEMANKGKTVIVAALDGTFQRQGFGNILQLVPLAESVIKLTAVCMFCYEEASFTKRIGRETELQVIGGPDKYMAVCRKCFLTREADPDSVSQTGDRIHTHTSCLRSQS